MDEDDDNSIDLVIQDGSSESVPEGVEEFLLEHTVAWQVEDDIITTKVTLVDAESKEVITQSEIQSQKTDDVTTITEEKDECNLTIDEKEFRCDVCEKKFGSKSTLNRHQLIHMSKKYKCEVCDKEFTYKCNLDVHKLNHSEIKAFKCEQCGKEFTQKCRLTSHQVIHTGIKAFECTVCRKTFISKSTLNRHKMTHSGIKRFKCEECGREFNEKCNLEVHQMTHAGIKPFKCDLCERSFSRKFSLNTHMTVHFRKGDVKKEDEETRTDEEIWNYEKNQVKSEVKEEMDDFLSGEDDGRVMETSTGTSLHGSETDNPIIPDCEFNLKRIEPLVPNDGLMLKIRLKNPLRLNDMGE